jgi:hypothetical protein
MSIFSLWFDLIGNETQLHMFFLCKTGINMISWNSHLFSPWCSWKNVYFTLNNNSSLPTVVEWVRKWLVYSQMSNFSVYYDENLWSTVGTSDLLNIFCNIFDLKMCPSNIEWPNNFCNLQVQSIVQKYTTILYCLAPDADFPQQFQQKVHSFTLNRVSEYFTGSEKAPWDDDIYFFSSGHSDIKANLATSLLTTWKSFSPFIPLSALFGFK